MRSQNQTARGNACVSLIQSIQPIDLFLLSHLSHSTHYIDTEMHTLWVRLNAVVFFGLSTLLALSVLAALSKLGHGSRHKPVIRKLKINKLRSLKPQGGVDRALLSFDIDVDLTPAFHWNIKQLFVYVIASYESDRNPKNEVVLWDKIVQAVDPPESKKIKQENVFVKYALVDQANDLRGKDVTLQLVWDHMPLTGLMFIGEQEKKTMTKFTLPSQYVQSS
jgi:signal peptidase complex subunit 3